jgi:hypothetical protein
MAQQSRPPEYSLIFKIYILCMNAGKLIIFSLLNNG